MILRDVGLATFTLKRDKRNDECAEFQRFEFEVNCVCDLYTRCLPKLATPETAKVVFDIMDEDDWASPSRIERLLSVTISPWRFTRASNTDEILAVRRTGTQAVCS